jgi:DNA-binding MarR family transcriptional regulator
MEQTTATNSRFDDVQRIAAFRAALRRFERTTELAAQAAGLTPRQYLLLLTIEGAPDGAGRATIGELADRLRLAQSTITGLVDRAQASGLVDRLPGQHDGRVVWVVCTHAGRQRLEEAIASLDADREALAEAAAALAPHLEAPASPL